jgi:hypothetical protein
VLGILFLCELVTLDPLPGFPKAFFVRKAQLFRFLVKRRLAVMHY